MKRKLFAAAAIATALAGCGSSGTKTVTVTTGNGSAASTTTSTGTTTATAGTAIAQTLTAPQRGKVTVHLSTFESPSTNIGCIIISGIARCDIRHRSWSPPPTPKSCPPVVNFGQGIEVSGSSRGRFVCAGDTALDPSAKRLAYGDDSQVGSFTCASRTNGMTCKRNRTGHGFFISAQGYRLF